MGAPTTPQEMADELNRHLAALREELESTHQAVEALSQRRRLKPELIFPFSLLDRLINRGLLSLERLVQRLVTTIVR